MPRFAEGRPGSGKTNFLTGPSAQADTSQRAASWPRGWPPLSLVPENPLAALLLRVFSGVGTAGREAARAQNSAWPAGSGSAHRKGLLQVQLLCDSCQRIWDFQLQGPVQAPKS